MSKNRPKIKEFRHYPIIAVRNSYITLQWSVKKAFFVFINNGIGFKKRKGIKLTTLNKSNTYKITAIGWGGISVKEINPIVLKVDNKLPKPQLIKSEIASINESNKNAFLKNSSIQNTFLKNAKSFNHINNLNIKYKELAVTPDIESLNEDLSNMCACETTAELDEFKKSIIEQNTD